MNLISLSHELTEENGDLAHPDGVGLGQTRHEEVTLARGKLDEAVAVGFAKGITYTDLRSVKAVPHAKEIVKVALLTENHLVVRVVATLELSALPGRVRRSPTIISNLQEHCCLRRVDARRGEAFEELLARLAV